MFPLLSTKLYFPHPHASLVPRPRLIERLVLGLGGPLTLISAPAGYGKTTLMSEWRLGVGKAAPAAWVSLDEGDNDLARFLLYIATALDTLQPGLLSDTLLSLQSPQPTSAENLLTILINDLNRFNLDFVLVLEDLHTLISHDIYKALAYLIHHQPAHMHIVLLTRSDPPLPMARLRSRGQLTEIRATDLRFSEEEAASFLNGVMKLHLPITDVSALELRTEGWISGLQLAALSIQGQEDVARFVKAFTGSHRYIVDYLVEEVLDCQPETAREFLLKTSILKRLTGSLCDALTGSRDRQATLIEMEHDNLFLIPLDDEQRWYRYHQLFADVLRKRLLQAYPESVTYLYRRAAIWCEQNDMLEEAVEYALAAQDYPLAVRLIEFSSWRMVTRSNISVILGWMRALPQELIQSRLRLCFNYAQALIEQHYFAEAEIFLEVIENAMRENSFTKSEAARELGENIDPALIQAAGGLSILERLPALLLLARCNAAILQENVDEAQVYCDQTLQRIPPADLLDHCVAKWFSGWIAFTRGDHTNAAQHLHEASQESQVCRHHLAYLDILNLLGLQAIVQGRLREAMSVFMETARYAQGLPDPIPPGIETIRIANIQREWNDLPAAAANIQRATRLAEIGKGFAFQRECYATQARLEQAFGNLEEALECLQKAEKIAHNTQTWRGVSPIKAMQARLWIAMGDLETAKQWAAAAGLAEDIPLHFEHEDNLLTLARLLLAQGNIAEARELLMRVQTFSASAGRQGRVIENLMLQALVHQASGRQELAADQLIEALRKAQPEGYIRLFADEGESMRHLISRCESRIAKNDPDLHTYAQKLLSAFPAPLIKPSILETQNLVEPLSARELEVLRLIATGRLNEDIAEELVIAIGTVKRHNANIFNKLDVRNRTEAVARARELNLL